jgi:hypothetical protein
MGIALDATAPGLLAGHELGHRLCARQCKLGQYAQVEAQLPRLRQVALDLGNYADLMRAV